MGWFYKIAISEKLRIERNVLRLENLRSKVHDLGYFAIASNSGGHQALLDLLDEKIVLGRPLVRQILEQGLEGENNQKLALDAPNKFHSIMNVAETQISREIVKEKRLLREFDE